MYIFLQFTSYQYQYNPIHLSNIPHGSESLCFPPLPHADNYTWSIVSGSIFNFCTFNIIFSTITWNCCFCSAVSPSTWTPPPSPCSFLNNLPTMFRNCVACFIVLPNDNWIDSTDTDFFRRSFRCWIAVFSFACLRCSATCLNLSIYSHILRSMHPTPTNCWISFETGPTVARFDPRWRRWRDVLKGRSPP